MGFTASEFRRCLPGAFDPLPLRWEGEDTARLTLASGSPASLVWRPLPARSIALITLQRLQVCFDFSAVPDAERQTVLRRFDLVMLRGGG
jgi:hypothetical protein